MKILRKILKRILREYENALSALFIWITFRKCKKVGKNISLHGLTLILGGHNVSIGDRVSFSGMIYTWGHGGVSIGDDVMLGSHVAISSVTHNSKQNPLDSCNLGKEVVIENNVWIGSHAFIDAGVTIGSGSIIGAGSVVLNDVSPKTLVAGVPAKKIKDL